MEKLENDNVSFEFQVQPLLKERKNIKLEYQKLFELIKMTWTQSKKEINELIKSVNQKTYSYGDVRTQNQDLLIAISELKANLKNAEKGEEDGTEEPMVIEAEVGGHLVYRITSQSFKKFKSVFTKITKISSLCKNFWSMVNLGWPWVSAYVDKL
ncbi:hypothetical protein Tco_0313731 [Tanacetum coccineum]